MVDSILYWGIIVALLLCIAWLLLAPAPGHDPLIQFMHGAMA